jgi:sodium/hydrogen antiporter
VPAAIREALNLESGLNDGICVPVIIILLDFAIGTEMQGSTAWHIFSIVVEEIGIGLVAGVVLTSIAVMVLRYARSLGWTSKPRLHIPVVALAGLCFTAAQALGGSGFIACFVGGLLFGFLERDRRLDLLAGAASTGEVLGTGMSASNKLFIGWFGPRGLASIVFAVIVFDAGLPSRSTLAVTATFTLPRSSRSSARPT